MASFEFDYKNITELIKCYKQKIDSEKFLFRGAKIDSLCKT